MVEIRFFDIEFPDWSDSSFFFIAMSLRTIGEEGKKTKKEKEKEKEKEEPKRTQIYKYSRIKWTQKKSTLNNAQQKKRTKKKEGKHWKWKK